MTVELPPRIAKLPRTRTGIPVPWVAAWSSEEVEYLAPDPLAAGRQAIFTEGDVGQGDPVLGIMDPPRQRISAARLICQVCARTLKRGHGWLALWPGQLALIDGQRLPLVMEPWVCFVCMAFALRRCPGLIGHHDAEDLTIVRPTAWGLVAALVDPIALDHDERSAVTYAEGGAVSFLKIVPTAGGRFEPEEFLRMAA